jgi:hypothetical protein
MNVGLSKPESVLTAHLCASTAIANQGGEGHRSENVQNKTDAEIAKLKADRTI